MKYKFPTIKEIKQVLVHCKKHIHDDSRCFDDPEDNIPGMPVTIGHNPETGLWDYQTGDNSYSGAAYGYPNWAVVYLYRRSNSHHLAKDAIKQLADLAWQ
jgi:hypothetical protein